MIGNCHHCGEKDIEVEWLNNYKMCEPCRDGYWEQKSEMAEDDRLMKRIKDA